MFAHTVRWAICHPLNTPIAALPDRNGADRLKCNKDSSHRWMKEGAQVKAATLHALVLVWARANFNLY